MTQDVLLPEEKARIKIDKQLINSGWDIVSRDEYIPQSASAVKEAIMKGNTESDYLLFVDDKAIAVVEAKRAENPLGEDVRLQAENYACNPQEWYGLWFPNQIPLVYLANGKKIYFKNMLQPDSDYVELTEMDSPKKMLQRIGQVGIHEGSHFLVAPVGIERIFADEFLVAEITHHVEVDIAHNRDGDISMLIAEGRVEVMPVEVAIGEISCSQLLCGDIAC